MASNLFQDFIWGSRSRSQGDTRTSIIGKTADEFGALTFWEAAEIMDYTISPFKCTAISENSASPGIGIQYIEAGKQLTRVTRDDGWVEAVTAHVMTKYGTSQRIDALPHWSIISATVNVAQAYHIDHPTEEENESETNLHTVTEIRNADMFYCSRTNKEYAGSIIAATQRNIEMVGGGKIRPGVAMHRREDPKAIACYDDKTTRVIFKLAGSIDDALEKEPRHWSPSIKGVFQQAYAPSKLAQTDTACDIVRVGNPGLYFWAYVKGSVLYISGWRSVNPNQACGINYARHLNIAQGNLIKEILVMMLLDDMPGGPGQWINGRDNSSGRFMTDTVVQMMRTGVSIWESITSIISQRKFSKSLKLGEVKIAGFLTTDNKSLSKHLNSKRPQPFCLKQGRVWRDGDWIVKVASSDERQAMIDVAGSCNVVELAGFMDVKFGRYKGAILLFIRNSGMPVSDVETDGDVMIAMRNALREIHQNGWHHHDVNPANVLRNKEGHYFLIDFSLAQRADECPGGEGCPDTYFLEYSGHSVSDTAEEEEE